MSSCPLTSVGRTFDTISSTISSGSCGRSSSVAGILRTGRRAQRHRLRDILKAVVNWSDEEKKEENDKKKGAD
ncbi:hypothetical protein GCK72_005137 [Caenorhabditis remanei]|uniref:Uncharacterized protein n=1 Tax=Caenorhabditis remanei TaxID=31234 RepID=A0A6A5HD15_CAERE|nr:hypothetical protein GCK72_005137 [Caenorhabditis remanei]KAF1765185.1 hypothetical protein GCK72_005137 [Caenorhabditis remanei]